MAKGKFINTTYQNTLDNLVTIHQDLVKNPFYAFSDKDPVKVRAYYNINNEKTTIDKASKLAYTDIGSESPIRFNVIYDLIIYQFPKIETQYDNSDFGLEANPITGESYILPNTFVPCDGDFFEIDHIKDSTWLFKVNDVQKDTLENGSNVYKIGWSLDRTTNIDILKNIVDEYKYLNVTEGTNIKSVIKLTNYEKAEKLDQFASAMKSFFIDLFYSDKVQTFIYPYLLDGKIYDPFALEFIRRNNLINTQNKFIFIDHKAVVPATFSIDYQKSLWHAIEEKNVDLLLKSCYLTQAKCIEDMGSIFSSRYEPYYMCTYRVYNNTEGIFNAPSLIYILDDDFVSHIRENNLYDLSDPYHYRNLIIKFFNNDDVTDEDIEAIDCIEYEQSYLTFYYILILLYCVDFYTKSLLS